MLPDRLPQTRGQYKEQRLDGSLKIWAIKQGDQTQLYDETHLSHETQLRTMGWYQKQQKSD